MGNDFEVRIDAIHKDFSSSRDMMYKALSDCYDLYCEVLRNPDKQTELKDIFVRGGGKDQANTDDATRLVRTALVKTAARANPYVQVFRRAREAGIGTGGLQGFIDKRGGIENIRLNKHKEDPVADDKQQYEMLLDAGRMSLAKHAVITEINDKSLLPEDNLGLLVVRRTTAGEGPLKVVDTISGEDGLFKSVLARYGRKG